LAAELRRRKITVVTFHDDTVIRRTKTSGPLPIFTTSRNAIWISVHNAFEQRTQPVGTEVWYVTQSSLAKRLSQPLGRLHRSRREVFERSAFLEIKP
jgi:hypothetical protein